MYTQYVLTEIFVSPHFREGIQWNLSITDTIGNQYFVPYSEVSLTQGPPVYQFMVGVVCVIRLSSTTWLHFQSFPLLYAGGEG